MTRRSFVFSFSAGDRFDGRPKYFTSNFERAPVKSISRQKWPQLRTLKTATWISHLPRSILIEGYTKPLCETFSYGGLFTVFPICLPKMSHKEALPRTQHSCKMVLRQKSSWSASAETKIAWCCALEISRIRIPPKKPTIAKKGWTDIRSTFIYFYLFLHM